MENPLLASEAQFRIGEMWMQGKNYEKAIASFVIVKEKFSGSEDWFSRSLLNLGECYEQTGNNDGATEIYRTLESLRPDDDFGKTAKSRLKRLGK
jgi:TolA-binding protein